MNEAAPRTPFLMKRRRLRRIGGVLIVLLVLISITDQLGLFGSDVNDWDHYDRTPWTVVRVINGDTLELENDAWRTIHVHLLGVDAPDDGAYWNDRATKYAMARALDQPVTLALDGTQTRDDAGDVLGYVYLSDVESLNFAMVRDGQAYADRRMPHTFAVPFEQAENVVRKNGTGLWKELPFEQMPAWRQQWVNDLAARRQADDSKMHED